MDLGRYAATGGVCHSHTPLPRDTHPSGFPVVYPAGDRWAPPAPLPGCFRGVLFDLGNVLYDDTLWRRWVRQLLSRVGLHTNYCSFFRIWDRDYLGDVHCGRRGFCEAFQAFLLASGLGRSLIDEIEAACRARRRQLEAEARALPGVKSTLERLHQSGLVLAAITNSEYPAPVLRQRLDQFAVGRLFAAVVSSIDLKRTMPDPACYLAALKALNLPAGEVAFVGHDAAELAGAAAAGMPTLAFNSDADARADVYLARFEELLEVIHIPPPLAAAG